MKYDDAKIDDMVMALLYVCSARDGHVWKGHDWDTLGRLHEKGLITNPVGRAKSIYLTDEGMKLGEALALKLAED